jgi:hypothetical protein
MARHALGYRGRRRIHSNCHESRISCEKVRRCEREEHFPKSGCPALRNSLSGELLTTESRQRFASPCLQSLASAVQMLQTRVPTPRHQMNATAHSLQIELATKALGSGHLLPAFRSKRKRDRRTSLMVRRRMAACLTSGEYILRTCPEMMTHRNASLHRGIRLHSCEVPRHRLHRGIPRPRLRREILHRRLRGSRLHPNLRRVVQTRESLRTQTELLLRN